MNLINANMENLRKTRDGLAEKRAYLDKHAVNDRERRIAAVETAHYAVMRYIQLRIQGLLPKLDTDRMCGEITKVFIDT